VALAAGALAVSLGAVLSDRAPYPYAMRRVLDMPLPVLTRRRLDGLLGVQPGEQVLEIGPGTGLQTLHVARQLGTSGRLTAVDVQAEMLRHVRDRAARCRIGRVTVVRADARALPFRDATFDAAYAVTVLGEVPAPLSALIELRRVLRPGGRLVIGEFADRHYLPPGHVTRLANLAGLHLDRLVGLPPLAYYARFVPCADRGGQVS